MHYLRESHARHRYSCSECGSSIPVGALYYRDEPHPMARRHRGAQVRHLCIDCIPREAIVTSKPPQVRPQSLGQLQLPFKAALEALPPLLFQTTIIRLGAKTEDGRIVTGVALPWFAIIDQLVHDPEFLAKVPWRQVEELVAGAYEREGWNVTLTPRSGDDGRDIIAERAGSCAVRIIDQVKALAPNRRVSADDVRAVLGVLASYPNVSKGIVTTTASFAPGIECNSSLSQFIPYRLELKDGTKLRRWLLELRHGG